MIRRFTERIVDASSDAHGSLDRRRNTEVIPVSRPWKAFRVCSKNSTDERSVRNAFQPRSNRSAYRVSHLIWRSELLGGEDSRSNFARHFPFRRGSKRFEKERRRNAWERKVAKGCQASEVFCSSSGASMFSRPVPRATIERSTTRGHCPGARGTWSFRKAVICRYAGTAILGWHVLIPLSGNRSLEHVVWQFSDEKSLAFS